MKVFASINRKVCGGSELNNIKHFYFYLSQQATCVISAWGELSISLHLSPWPSKLGRQSCCIAWLLIRDSAEHSRHYPCILGRNSQHSYTDLFDDRIRRKKNHRWSFFAWMTNAVLDFSFNFHRGLTVCYPMGEAVFHLLLMKVKSFVQGSHLTSILKRLIYK